MSGIKRTNQRASIKDVSKQEMQEVKLEKAWVLPAEVGENLLMFLGNLPYKFKADLDQLVPRIGNAPRANVTINVPKKPEGDEKK